MLGDHFWPAMYPGIIVGALVGLSTGNVVSTILGAVGGLLGAMALYFVFTWVSLDESILSLAGLIGGAVVGAYLMMRAGRRLRQA
jgi:hypothetical protein